MSQLTIENFFPVKSSSSSAVSSIQLKSKKKTKVETTTLTPLLKKDIFDDQIKKIFESNMIHPLFIAVGLLSKFSEKQIRLFYVKKLKYNCDFVICKPNYDSDVNSLVTSYKFNFVNLTDECCDCNELCNCPHVRAAKYYLYKLNTVLGRDVQNKEVLKNFRYLSTLKNQINPEQYKSNAALINFVKMNSNLF